MFIDDRHLKSWLPQRPCGTRRGQLASCSSEGRKRDLDATDQRDLVYNLVRCRVSAEIDGARVDVVSDGPLIDAGQFVEVTRVDGNRIVVRRLPHINAKE